MGPSTFVLVKDKEIKDTALGRYRNVSVCQGRLMESIPGSRCDRGTAASPPVASDSPVDNWTLQPLLLHSFVFPRVPAADQHSAQPSGTTYNHPCSAEHSSSSVVWFLNCFGKQGILD